MSANDKLAATFGPGRTTPTPALETRIAEVLAAHSIGAFSGDSTACQCDRTWRKNADHRKHLTEALAAVLAPVIADAQAEAWDACVHAADKQWTIGHTSAQLLRNTNPYRSNDE